MFSGGNMAKNNSVKGNFHYNNTEKMNKNFMYNNLTRSNCYNSSFAGSNFNFASFRGAHFKSCDFYGCTFKSAEFIGTNLKNSKFRYGKFEDTLFEGVNLSEVDFRDAEFKNTIFVECNLDTCKSLFFDKEEVTIYEEMPKLNISEELEEAINKAMGNKFIKASRVIDTKEGKINPIKIIMLQKKYNEEVLIKGFNDMAEAVDRDFYTLSYLFRFFK